MYNCPFCGSGEGQNRTGACKYYPVTNTFFCHACKNEKINHNPGDIFTLIEMQCNVDFNEALKIGAEQLGIDLSTNQTMQQSHESVNLLNVQGSVRKPSATSAESIESEEKIESTDYSWYCNLYNSCLEVLDEADDYLLKRGISKENAIRCGIGLDLHADPANAPGAYSGDMEGKRHPEPRLIIPMNNGSYMGRSINPNIPKAYAKVNAKGTTPGLFNADVLYNSRTVFVVEGAFDALSLEEIGVSAIALNSSNNGKLLIDLLKRDPTDASLIICFDADKSKATAKRTRKEAENLNKMLEVIGTKSVVFDLSIYVEENEKDINDILVNRGKDVLLEIVKKAESEADELSSFLYKIQSEAYRPYETGLKFFDELLNGGAMQQSMLLLMAAPSAGKTALAQQIAEEMASRKKKVIYLNFEMSREQMYARAISNRLKVKYGKNYSALKILQGYKWEESEKEDIITTANEYRSNNYKYISYNPNNVTSDLDTITTYLNQIGERAKVKGEEAPIIFVDYLHLISSSKRIDTQELIKQATYTLKNYAKNYNTLVFAIVATNRESNKGGRITLESGRDSSNIEYSADYVLSLN